MDYKQFNGNDSSRPSYEAIKNEEEKKRKSYEYFEFIVVLTHIMGIVFLVLDGYFFGTTQGGLQWKKESQFLAMSTSPHSHGLLNMHGFFMTSAFIFFQGEALIAYRVYRHEIKLFSKSIHVLFHVAAAASASFGLAAVIRNKYDAGDVHMYSFHSWLGVLVFGSYDIQFIIGFINYAYPKTDLEVRKWFMPYHRTFGNLIFVLSIVTVLVGHQRFSCFAFNQQPIGRSPCDRTHKCTKRLDWILNFSTIFIIFYSFLILYILREDEWKREQTPDEKVHKE